MVRRAISAALLLWVLGFAAWVFLLPGPIDGHPTDAIVVPTGAQGRIARGVALLKAKQAHRMLISGVDRSVKPGELAVTQDVPPDLLKCCIDLGREAVDTRSNATETAAWIAARHYGSVRLVTSDWHMRRAELELRRALDPSVVIVPDAVQSAPGLGVLLLEYNKYLVRRIAATFGG